MSRRTPARRQRDPERTREQIVHAATHEFAEKGYAGARVGAIAERAGVNKQLISYYFGGKEGLYREISARWLSAEHEAGQRHQQMTLGEVTAAYLDSPRELTRLFLWEGLDAGSERAARDAGSEGTDREPGSDSGERATRAKDGSVAGPRADPGEPSRTTRMTAALRDLEQRQAAGELDADIDPRAFLLTFMGAALMPTGMPQVVRSIYGSETDPDSPEFRQRYAEQLETMVARLANDDPGGQPPRS